MRFSLRLPGGALRVSDGSGLRAALKHGAPRLRLGPLLFVWWSSESQRTLGQRRMRGQRRL